MTLRRFSTSSLSTGTKSHKLWDGETFPGYFESIATVTVGSAGQSTVTFSNIPQNYTHLQIRGIGRNNTGDAQLIRFNSDSGTNYVWHQFRGNGSSASAANLTGRTAGEIPFTATNSATSGIFGAFVTDILDYANTNKNKTIRSLGGADLNGSGQVQLGSALWLNTAAITSIDIIGESTFQQYSHFALYGIRSA